MYEYTDMYVSEHLHACVWTYMLKAAADAGFDVGASEGGHLPQLPRDLDGFMKQQTELPLVTRVTCWRYLAEEVWAGEGGVEVGEAEREGEREKKKKTERGSERKSQSMWVMWYLKYRI